MTVLSLSPKPLVGAVLIQVTGAPAGPVSIVRTDDNGTRPVRLQANQAPIGGSLTIFDYEVMFNSPATYTVTDSALTVVSGTVNNINPWVTVPFIHAPILPNFRQDLVAVMDYGAEQDTSTTVHWVIDRPDPLVNTGPLRYRTGSLDVYAQDYATAESIRQIASHGEVLMLRQPDYTGMDMYFIPSRVSTRPKFMETIPRRWSVSFDYVEVKSPSGYVQSGTWNYDEIKAVGTYNTIKAQFPTYNALVAGP